MTEEIKTLSEKLKNIKDDVTAQDKKEYIAISGFSKNTVIKYLNGKVSYPDIALYMLLFFKSRIQKRQAQLENA